MNSAGSRAKGATWERDVGRKLSLWLTNGEQSDIFNRNTRGGSGDLRANHPIAWHFLQDFSVECKCWKTADLVDWFLKASEKSKIARAIAQAKKDAKDRDFFLIVKQNYREPFVLTEIKFSDRISYLHQHILFGRYLMFSFESLLSTRAIVFDNGLYFEEVK